MKISEVIQAIIDWQPVQVGEHTRDTVKYGDIEKECTGVAVTVCGTLEAVREAAALGCNLIITHEGIFWGDEFDAEKEFGGDEILAEKKRVLDEAGIAVWRFHDHMHGGGLPDEDPADREFTDYIYYGIMKTLGWEPYLVGSPKKPLKFEIPETTVEDLCKELTEKAGLTGIRTCGSTTGKVSKVFFCEHAQGRFDARIIREAADCDVLIPLEIVDWTVSCYVRDAVACGKTKVILEPGHFNFEEMGMKYMCEWLPPLLDPALPVHYIQSGDSFNYYVK